MAVILRVLILFSSVLTALNFDFRKASVINRYGHYSCTAHHTTQTGHGKPVVRMQPTFSNQKRHVREIMYLLVSENVKKTIGYFFV